jgi:hypothetical protein
LADYGAAMRRRAGLADGGAPAMAQWLTPQWADGASALVLTAGVGPVLITDLATSFRPYCPEAHDLDPGIWVTEALARIRDHATADLAAVETCGPSTACEMAASAPLLAEASWQGTDARVNASGGGANAYFGPATGLRHIARVATALKERSGSGIAIDLAGPIGQATTVVALRGRGR